MNKFTAFILSLFSNNTIEDTIYITPVKRVVNPKTRAIRLVVESVIGKNYWTLYSDKLKNGRKVKFYKVHSPLTPEVLSTINEKLSELGVTAVINNSDSLVVKYWDTV